MDTRTSHDGIGRAYAEHISWQKLAFFDQYLALIPKTLQDTVIVTHMEDEWELVRDLLNGAIFNDLQ